VHFLTSFFFYFSNLNLVFKNNNYSDLDLTFKIKRKWRKRNYLFSVLDSGSVCSSFCSWTRFWTLPLHFWFGSGCLMLVSKVWVRKRPGLFFLAFQLCCDEMESWTGWRLSSDLFVNVDFELDFASLKVTVWCLRYMSRYGLCAGNLLLLHDDAFFDFVHLKIWDG